MDIYKEGYWVIGKWVKYVLPICLFICLPLTIQAQVGEYRTDFAVGVNGGYLLNQVSFTPTVPQKMMGGLTGVSPCAIPAKSISAVSVPSPPR